MNSGDPRTITLAYRYPPSSKTYIAILEIRRWFSGIETS